MSSICPTVMITSDDLHVFRAMMERVGLLGSRVQIDLMDGDFAPHHNIDPSKIWWPEGVRADIHLMYKHPDAALQTLIALKPHLIIVHAEAETDVAACVAHIRVAGIRAGIALLAETPVAAVANMIDQVDHVLLFGGKLGEDGQSDLRVLEKVAAVRRIRSSVEIGWDGGANEQNIAELAAGGIDVINVGGTLRHAEDPAQEYSKLVALLG